MGVWAFVRLFVVGCNLHVVLSRDDRWKVVRRQCNASLEIKVSTRDLEHAL